MGFWPGLPKARFNESMTGLSAFLKPIPVFMAESGVRFAGLIDC